MDPIQALDMLNQVVKGIRLPYADHVLLERSVDVLRDALQSGNQEPADILGEEEPVVLEETAGKKAKARRGGRRKK